MVGERIKKAKEELSEKLTGERIAKLLEKTPKKAKQEILKVLENLIEKGGKIITGLKEKLHITDDEIKLLFKGTLHLATLLKKWLAKCLSFLE